MKRYFVITAILISVAVFFSCSREFDFSLDKVSSGIQMKELLRRVLKMPISVIASLILWKTVCVRIFTKSIPI